MGRRALSPRAAEAFKAPRPAAAAAPLLTAAILGALVSLVVATPLLLVVAAGCLMLAGLRALFAARDRALLRRQADALLSSGLRVHPQSGLVVWRSGELTAARNRTSLARSLGGFAAELERPASISPVPLNRRAVGPHLPLIHRLADRLAHLERPVSPRGMVLVEELVTNGLTSPLYLGGRAGDVRRALADCLEALEEQSVAREVRDRAGRPADRSSLEAVLLSGGRH
jgi:hypothetical protein